MKYALLTLSMLAFGLAVYSQIKLSALKTQNESLINKFQALEKMNAEEEYELAVGMGRMQIYFSKLWFAGSLPIGNWQIFIRTNWKRLLRKLLREI